MASHTFEFDSPKGYKLSGHLAPPETTPRGWAILAHCFTCGKDSLAAVRIARALSRVGIGVLRFDFAGLGTSEGNFADSTFAADVGDLVAAGDAMIAAGMKPSLLIGHSFGGAAALAAAHDMPSILAIATIAAPADVPHVLHQFDTIGLDRIRTDGEAQVQIGDRPFVLRKSFLDDLEGHDLEACVAQLHRALLILHSPVDQTVGIEHASRIFQAARHPKSFLSLAQADHLLTDKRDADYVAAMIAAWATRYLPPLMEDMPQVEAARGVSAEETGGGLLQVEIRAGDHHFYADEPVSVGGLASGPSPYELVSAGLAACTIMTMRLYANRKGMPLEHASVRVEHSKQPDLSPTDRFTRTITLTGPLDDDQRRRILAIADRCPVDLTLVRGSDIQTLPEGSDENAE